MVNCIWCLGLEVVLNKLEVMVFYGFWCVLVLGLYIVVSGVCIVVEFIMKYLGLVFDS